MLKKIKNKSVGCFAALYNEDLAYRWGELKEGDALECCKCHKTTPYHYLEDNGGTCLFKDGYVTFYNVCWLCGDCTKECRAKKKLWDALKYRPGYKDCIVLIYPRGEVALYEYLGINDVHWHSFRFQQKDFKKWRYLHSLADGIKLEIPRGEEHTKNKE